MSLPVVWAFLHVTNMLASGYREGPLLAQLIGEAKKYTVKRGESLYSIARKNGVGTIELMRSNKLNSNSVKPGATLTIPTIHIPPLSIPDGIVLNVPERAVYLFRNGAFVRRFAGAVGKSSGQTATGTYVLRNKVVNPTWRPPRSMVINEGVKDAPVPPGPRNPLGDRWMGWSKPGFGFHSTLSPRSIGRAASHGCVRLYPEGARDMFRLVTVGMPIHSIYRPAVLGKRDGFYYLSVFQDVYRRGGGSLKDVNKLLESAGLLGLAEESLIKSIAANQPSSPMRILGEGDAIEVDGAVIDSAIRPVKTGGIWMLPLRGVAEALGISVEPLGEQMMRIRKDARTCEFQVGEKNASLDGQQIEFTVAPSMIEGNLLVPLRALLDLTGAVVQIEKGKAIRIHTSKSGP